MFLPARIDNDFVPYTKRRVLRRNAGLFVDAGGPRGRDAARAVPQRRSMGMECVGKPDCYPCDGGYVCVNEYCVSLYSQEAEAANCRLR